jgi:DNA (cytosine-5)-methyltransferase 1
MSQVWSYGRRITGGYPMKIGSLCTGYGGLDMAVEAFFNAETIWTCELDKYASQVIDKRINKINHGDLKTTDWTKVEPIDILTAGYPCQPFSHAGSRKGVNDERHLWPHIKEIIRILQPQFVILENVRGHFGLGFREVLGDLASIRYDATWRLVRASDVGAPHRRERLFILAYAQSRRSRQHSAISKTLLEHRNGVTQHSNTNGDGFSMVGNNVREKGNQRQSQFISSQLVEKAISDTSSQCFSSVGNVPKLGRRFTSRREMHLREIPAALDQGKLNAKFVEYMMGLPDGWVTDIGLSRAQQLKILGNGVVPQQAEYALELLWETYVNE